MYVSREMLELSTDRAIRYIYLNSRVHTYVSKLFPLRIHSNPHDVDFDADPFDLDRKVVRGVGSIWVWNAVESHPY